VILFVQAALLLILCSRAPGVDPGELIEQHVDASPSSGLRSAGRSTLLRLGEKYAEAVKQAGDPVQVSVIPDTGHFEPASPVSPTWLVIRQATRSLLAEERLR
jgi:acetyl esterase/lipase